MAATQLFFRRALLLFAAFLQQVLYLLFNFDDAKMATHCLDKSCASNIRPVLYDASPSPG